MRTERDVMENPMAGDVELAELLKLARRRGPMTEREQREQVISFVYGNLKLSGWLGTLDDVAQAYDRHIAQPGGEA